MKVAVYSTRSYDRSHLEAANTAGAHQFIWIEDRLSSDNTALARGCVRARARPCGLRGCALLGRYGGGGTQVKVSHPPVVVLVSWRWFVVVRVGRYPRLDFPHFGFRAVVAGFVPAGG